VVLFTTAGNHVPFIPAGEVLFKAGGVDPEHILKEPKPGLTFALTVVIKV
jgi:hypothetical protein